MLKVYFIVLNLLILNFSHAKDPQSTKNSSKLKQTKNAFRQVELGTPHRFITTGAKFTSGIVQTTGGLLHLVWFPIVYGSFDSNKRAALEGVNPKGKTYNLKLATRGEQLNIVFNQWNGFYPSAILTRSFSK